MFKPLLISLSLSLFFLVLQLFRDYKERNPQVGASLQDDRMLLERLCEEVTGEYKISPDLINKEFVE